MYSKKQIIIYLIFFSGSLYFLSNVLRMRNRLFKDYFKYGKLSLIAQFKVYCAFLNGIEWNTTGMSVGLIKEDSVECITNHLTCFAIVVFDSEPEVSILVYV